MNRPKVTKEMVFMPGQLQKLEKYFTHWAPIVGPENGGALGLGEEIENESS